jgi:transposase
MAWFSSRWPLDEDFAMYRSANPLINHDLAAQSAIRQMMHLAKTLLSHKSGILSWLKQRINNGRMEGINNKIKTLLRQTYGLRDERYFVLKLYSLHHSRQDLLG